MTDPTALVAALEASEAYLGAQEELGERLRKGFWCLAKARLRAGASWVGPGFCRNDLGAARRIRVEGPEGGGGFGLVIPAAGPRKEVMYHDDDGDLEEEPAPCKLEDLAVIVAGGLASPELREAQEHFGQVLECVLQLASAVRPITSVARTEEGAEEEPL